MPVQGDQSERDLRRDARFAWRGCLALGGAGVLLIAGLAALIVLGVNWLSH